MVALLCSLLLMSSVALADESHFLKDIHIAPSDSVHGDFSLYKGDLFLEGHIDGNVSIMMGDCALSETATISGDLSVLQGALELPDRSQVAGRVFQKDFLAGDSQIDEDPFSSPSSFDDMQCEDESDDVTYDDEESDLFLSFNRVAGLQFGMTFRHDIFKMHPKSKFDVTGRVAYAFAAHRPEWSLKLRKRLMSNPELYVAIGHYRLTDTADGWMMSSTDNSLAGVFLHYDFRDYFDNHGALAELGMFQLDNRIHLSAAYFREHYGPLDLGTQWSWHSGRSYRPNLYNTASGYPVASNEGLRFAFRANFGEEDESKTGGQFVLKYEVGDEPDSGFDYTRWLAQGSARYTTAKDAADVYSLRVLAGSLDGTNWPIHYGFRLGGPGTLPGYHVKGLDGLDDGVDARLDRTILGQPRMLLVNFEDRIDGDIIPFWPFDAFLLLADAGSVFSKSFSELEAADLFTDLGFGMAETSGDNVDFRFSVLRSTATSHADWRMSFSVTARF
jgi:hypothetical protein